MQQQSGVTVIGGPVGPVTGTIVPPGPVRTATMPRPFYDSRQSVGLGVTLILLGILAITFNAVGLAVSDNVGAVAHGFWAGTFFILTGSFGVAAGVHKAKCLIITFMVLSILSAVLTIGLLAAGIGGSVAAAACDYNGYGFHCNRFEDSNGYNLCSYSPPCHSNDKWRVAVAMEASLAVLGLIAAIVCIWSAVICCKAVCCCSRSTSTGMVIGRPYYGEGMIIVSSHQQQQSGMASAYAAGGPAQQVPPYCVSQAPPAYGYNGAGYQYWMPQPQQPYAPAMYSANDLPFYQPSAPVTGYPRAAGTAVASAVNPNYSGPSYYPPATAAGAAECQKEGALNDVGQSQNEKF